MEAENLSNLNASVLQSAAEATQTKDNLPLSLVGDVSDIIVDDSFPEEASADIIVDKTDGEDHTKEIITTIDGSFNVLRMLLNFLISSLFCSISFL